jgi:hypothetical protein
MESTIQVNGIHSVFETRMESTLFKNGASLINLRIPSSLTKFGPQTRSRAPVTFRKTRMLDPSYEGLERGRGIDGVVL